MESLEESMKENLAEIHQKAIAENQWQALLVFNLYRLGLTVFLLASFALELKTIYIGSDYPNLFLSIVIIYFAFSIICFVLMVHRFPRFDIQVVLQVLVDIVVLTALIRASNGATSSLGVLINVAIAGGSMLTPGRISLLFAALASIAVLSELTLAVIMDRVVAYDYMDTAILSATFFATAIMAYVLSRRMRKSEALAREHRDDIETLEKLNNHVIQRMRSGIMVVREDNSVRLINDAARLLLSYDESLVDNVPLSSVSSILNRQLIAWRIPPHRQPSPFKIEHRDIELITQFTALEEGFTKSVLVFLEDSSRTAKQAQEMKLVSLGRLSASIAHEIRNPLAAISHAAQLLSEDNMPSANDKKFLNIIVANSDRVNAIINSVLHLSRRNQVLLAVLALQPWLAKFKQEFMEMNNREKFNFAFSVTPATLEIKVDAIQFHQIMNNLCENALRYGVSQCKGFAKIDIKAYRDKSSNHVCVDVIDNGPGIAPHVAENLFEPFYTTHKQGSGLGLYIAKEMCEANSARLTLEPLEESGCCFRITFYE